MPNFLSSINLNQNELQKAVIENYAGNPSGTVSGVDGQMLYDSTNNLVYICEGGTTWVSLSSASGTVTSVSAGNAITISGTSTDPIVNHADTSTQADVNNSGNDFIQDVTLDTYGHVTGLTSASVSFTGYLTDVDTNAHENVIATYSGTTDTIDYASEAASPTSSDFSLMSDGVELSLANDLWANRASGGNSPKYFFHTRVDGAGTVRGAILASTSEFMSIKVAQAEAYQAIRNANNAAADEVGTVYRVDNANANFKIAGYKGVGADVTWAIEGVSTSTTAGRLDITNYNDGHFRFAQAMEDQPFMFYWGNGTAFGNDTSTITTLGVRIDPSSIAVDGTNSPSTPNFRFLDDGDTGMYLASTGVTAFASGGSKVLTIPATAGSAGQYFTTDGSGNGQWTTLPTSDNYVSWTAAGDTGTDAVTSGQTLTFAGGTNVTTSLSGTTLTINATNTVTDAFTTISVSGQSDVVADSTSDTLTLAAGANTTITTNATTDTITIASSDTIDYISAVSFNSGTGDLEFTAVGNAHATNVSLDGRYLTSYTETQTLDDVTDLGATTTNAITVGGLTVNGDLTVSGTHTVKLAETVQIEDSLILLNQNETGTPTEDAGFVIERGTSTNVGFMWDESADEFVLFSGTETGATTGNVTISDYQPIHVGGLTTEDASTIGGTLTLSSVVNAGVDTDKFLVLDSGGEVDFRTGAEVRSDIGAGTMSSFTIDADSGTANSITNGETFTIVGGGDVSTSVGTNQVTVSFTESYTQHETISAASSVDNSGNDFIQDITLDSNGHVTGLASGSVSGFDNYGSWTVSDGTNTEAIGSGDSVIIAGGGDVTTSYASASNTLTVSFTETYTAHENITAASSINGSGIDFIQDVTVDSNGHVTGLAAATIRSATDALTGVVELATTTEASTGTDTTRAVTAAGVEQFRADREAVFTISGDASTTAFALTHNFGTRMVMAEIVDFGDNGTGATYETVYADVTRNTDNQVTVTFGSAPSATQDYRVMLRVIS